MNSIAETIARLGRMRGPYVAASCPPSPCPLVPLSDFGTNPGNLLAKAYVPHGLAPGAALVVVLHGCTQSADSYDRGAGWSELADEAGFALLYPEQQRANNANLCFNWFEPDDVRRDHGEVLSIRQMVSAMLARHDLNPARVFVTGLSAGGAMTAALLAAYPDVFAGGAIVAGLPFGAARNVSEALQRMRTAAPVHANRLRGELQVATGHRGPWPTVSVWHGTADAIVHASNAGAIVEQWRTVHGAGTEPFEDRRIDGQRCRVWRDHAGRAVVEAWDIAGMGHGTPLAVSGADACGTAGAHMLDVGISSTRHIARFWGLLPTRDAREDAAATPPRASRPRPRVEPESGGRRVDVSGPGAVIENALRAAGLMK